MRTACSRPRSISAAREKKLVPRVGLKFSETMILVLGNIRRPSKMFVWSPYWDRSRRCALKRSKDDGLHRFFRWLWKLLENFQLVFTYSHTECEMTVKWLPMKTASEVSIRGGSLKGCFGKGIPQRPSNPDPACLRQQSFISLPWSRQDTLFHYPDSFRFCIQNYVIFHTNNMELEIIKSLIWLLILRKEKLLVSQT